MVRLRLFVAFVCLVCLETWGEAAPAKLPPVGKRVYIVDKTELYEPTKISKDDHRPSRPFLKDPLQPNPNRPKKVHKPKPYVAKKLPKQLPARLSFRALAVEGRLSRPRVAFEQERLPVERVDEPLKLDFLERIFETTKAREGF